MNLSYRRRTVDRREIGVLIGFVLSCELVGILGALATAPAIETWYTTIAKPGFTPP
jgi:tryptophan-rich sensory protein